MSPRLPLRLLADANIPHVEAAFRRFGNVRALPGRAIGPEHVAEVDVLLVRSVTSVEAALLAGTPVQFVGTATAGTDHLDLEWLARTGIEVASAPGSNAESVVEYVLAALLALASECGTRLRGKTLGVIGCGHVGGRLVPRAEALGLRVLSNDPPLAEAAEARGDAHPYVSLEHVLAASDIVTLHTPLTREAEVPHPTFHLIGAKELAALQPHAWLVNASRGAVVDSAALRDALGRAHLGAVVLDVWEGEPMPDLTLARRVNLGTPHIAGYSYDGKVEGTRMLEEALRRWLSREGIEPPPPWEVEAVLAPSADEPLRIAAPLTPVMRSPASEAAWLDALARQAYDLRADDVRFRAAVVETTPVARGAAFQALRKSYPRRRAWTRFTVEGEVPSDLHRAVTEGLGMRSVK